MDKLEEKELEDLRRELETNLKFYQKPEKIKLGINSDTIC